MISKTTDNHLYQSLELRGINLIAEEDRFGLVLSGLGRNNRGKVKFKLCYCQSACLPARFSIPVRNSEMLNFTEKICCFGGKSGVKRRYTSGASEFVSPRLVRGVGESVGSIRGAGEFTSTFTFAVELNVKIGSINVKKKDSSGDLIVSLV